MKTGKRYAEAMKNVDRAALYDVADAISIAVSYTHLTLPTIRLV